MRLKIVEVRYYDVPSALESEVQGAVQLKDTEYIHDLRIAMDDLGVRVDDSTLDKYEVVE